MCFRARLVLGFVSLLVLPTLIEAAPVLAKLGSRQNIGLGLSLGLASFSEFRDPTPQSGPAAGLR